ncbi:MAG: hypothetical protein WBW41_06800 [Verrucomicrobiia bacterium]
MDEDDPLRKQRMEQQERFAVGIIGFVLEHDSGFRKHFLEKVCGLNDTSEMDGWEILIEPENWGDLVLKHRASNSLIVTEFKIGAELAGHQNPSSPAFKLPSRDGCCAGYGWEITQIAAKENWARLKYITVEKKASWSKAGERNASLICFPAEWSKFLREEVSEETKLETEVYDCLARFGVSIFTSRRMKNMKLANQATQPLAILIGVLGKFGVGFRYKLLKEVDPEALGLSIVPKDFPKIARIVQSEVKVAGWFGYESNAPLGPRLSVWFYCYKQDVGIKPAAKAKIEEALKKNGFNENEFRNDGYSVNVFCKSEDSTGDMEWFTKVLSALN